MATMLDVVTRALRLTGAIEAGETPSAEDGKDGTEILNHMLHGWAKQGVDLGHKTLTQAQTLPYDDSYLEGIVYNLAARFGVEWGRPINPAIIANAGSHFAAFQAHTLEFDDFLSVDNALRPQYFRRRSGAYDIDEG